MGLGWNDVSDSGNHHRLVGRDRIHLRQGSNTPAYAYSGDRIRRRRASKATDEFVPLLGAVERWLAE
jgi:hypothetical protein